MNTLFFYTAFTFFSILFYLPSLWARYAFSGRNFSAVKFWCVMIYNVMFISFHIDFVEKKHIPFIGERDNSVIGWLSFFLIFAYGYAIPVNWKITCWFSRKKEVPKEDIRTSTKPNENPPE